MARFVKRCCDCVGILLCLLLMIRYNHRVNTTAFSETEGEQTADDRGTLVEEDRFYKVWDIGDYKYHLEIYNGMGEMVKAEDMDDRYKISYVDEHTIEILHFAGTGVFFCTYYDTAGDRLSGLYDCPQAAGYDRVAYLDYHEDLTAALVIKNLYEDTVYFDDVISDMSFEVLFPVKSAKFSDAEHLSITYAVNKEYDTKTTVLSWQSDYDGEGSSSGDAGVVSEEMPDTEQLLWEKIPELQWIEEAIMRKSGGEATLWIDRRGQEEFYSGDENLGMCDVYYVGELWEDHTANWYWFAVSETDGTVYWIDAVEWEAKSLSKWREQLEGAAVRAGTRRDNTAQRGVEREDV